MWKMIGSFPKIALVFFALLLITLRARDDDYETMMAHELVTDALSDSDLVRSIELETGENIRDQIGVEELNDIHREVELLRMGNSRN